MLIALYVDDAGLAAASMETINELVEQLWEMGFELTKESSFSAFLGIGVESLPDGSLKLTQRGLIDKILTATKMQDCNPNVLPHSRTHSGSDPDCPLMQ